MMGFDTFTSKECMNISQYTPNGNWPTDDVLVQETVKAMNATENQSDFVYTITVEGHGDYPTEKILEIRIFLFPAPQMRLPTTSGNIMST